MPVIMFEAYQWKFTLVCLLICKFTQMQNFTFVNAPMNDLQKKLLGKSGPMWLTAYKSTTGPVSLTLFKQ